MKQFLPLLLICMLAASANAQQTALQAGVIATPFINKGFSGGGELIGNLTLKKNLSGGIGLQVWKLQDVQNIYAPVFATFKYFIPTKKLTYFFHADPGYSIYNLNYAYHLNDPDGAFDVNFKNTGGFYLGTGAGVHLNGKLSPYFNVQYSLFSFRYHTSFKETVYDDHSNSGTVTFSAGIWLGKKKS